MIENTFGVCSSRFRVLYRPKKAEVENVIAIIKAIVALHNGFKCS